MKKVLKIFHFIFWLLTVAYTVLYFVVPAIKELTTPYVGPFVQYIFIAAVVFTGLYVVRFFIHISHREMGSSEEIKVKRKTKKDKNEGKELKHAVRDDDVYVDFERAEFNTKFDSSYDKEVVVEAKKEEIKEEKVETKVEEPKEEKVEETPVKKVVKEEPKIEKVEEKPIVSVPETKAKTKKSKLVTFKLWEGNAVKILDSWEELITKLADKPRFKNAVKTVKELYDENRQCYPTKENIFKPFELTDLNGVKAVIIGKFPFYRKDQADGLAFSTNATSDINQTTDIIIKECVDDVKIKQPANGSLENWAKQGVLLLNSTLTAPSDKPASHEEIGWRDFTNEIIKYIAKDPTPKVFILWGQHAEEYREIVSKNKANLILSAPNPSPLSASNGFYGSKPFSQTNEYLKANGIEPIDWTL